MKDKRRKRSSKRPDSLIAKHYALFHSLSRYTLSPPPEPKRTRKTNEQAAAKTHKLHRHQQKYPAGGLWALSWPLPLPRLPGSSHSDAGEKLDELVSRIVSETFHSEYSNFRTLEWGRAHRITEDHRQLIIVDPREVEESATAARALVKTALNRFITGVKKGAIGNPSQTRQREEGEEDEVEKGLNEEIYGETGKEGEGLEWKELLTYMQGTAGGSKTAQWRNWHLLKSVGRARERCEEMFGAE